MKQIKKSKYKCPIKNKLKEIIGNKYDRTMCIKTKLLGSFAIIEIKTKSKGGNKENKDLIDFISSVRENRIKLCTKSFNKTNNEFVCKINEKDNPDFCFEEIHNEIKEEKEKKVKIIIDFQI